MSLIYSRVIVMQLTAVESIFKHGLAPMLTSTFNYDGDLRPAKPKADLRRTLEPKVSTHTMIKLELTIDGSPIWVVNGPTMASVINDLQNFSSYILQKHATVFD